ncbi:hypothetical protein ACFWHV_21875 [Streptomyces collinus]|uniref:hypothetical protein n=1 Tax=Streptomyces collinus TaxID=42684 RepID=UPI00364B287D
MLEILDQEKGLALAETLTEAGEKVTGPAADRYRAGPPSSLTATPGPTSASGNCGRWSPTHACRSTGALLHSDGKLTIVSLAVEAGLRRNKLTHKHPGLKDLFYALVKARNHIPEPVSEAAQARGRKQQEDLVRVRAERDDLRSQAQLLARIVQVLEIENHRLKEAHEALEQQLAARAGVPDLASRRLPP